MTDYDPTIEDSYTKQCVIDDVVAKLDSEFFVCLFFNDSINLNFKKIILISTWFFCFQ